MASEISKVDLLAHQVQPFIFQVIYLEQLHTFRNVCFVVAKNI